MRKIGFIIGLVVATIVFLSCKREKKEFIGPELGIASSNFQIVDAFVINDEAIDFGTDSNWFNATFNEHVSWNIKIRGVQSKAEKNLKGVSSGLTMYNSLWRGGHSGLNFFQAGETIISELTVFGSDRVWYDTSTIVAVRNNFGPNTIIWWDMDQLGVAKNNIDCYWFEYYDTGEKIAGDFGSTTTLDVEPLQGVHRTLHGKELTVPVDYYIGGASHTNLTSSRGFSASTEDVYLNFYVRKRTPTTSIGVTLISVANTDTSGLSYETGTITWEGWKLVSVKLSEMAPNSKYPNPFSPGNIRQFGTFLQTYTNTNVETGFDLDFVTITKNGPFNPDLY
jgi:hypothetical protein